MLSLTCGVAKDGNLTVSRVIWFNLGNHHVPHTGDLPNTLMTTSASSVMFSPHNYHLRNRAATLAHGVRVEGTGRDGEPKITVYGDMAKTSSFRNLRPDLPAHRKLPVDENDLSV